MSNKEFVTEIEVVLKKNRKFWEIKKNDYDPDSVGEITTGPFRAKDLALGTKYTTTLNIVDYEEE